MTMSHHAKKRSQQRGIPSNIIDLILQIGSPLKRPGNATEYRVRKKDKQKVIQHLKGLIQEIDKVTGKAVIVSDDDNVITVYPISEGKR